MTRARQASGVLPLDWGGSTDGAAAHQYTVYSVVLDNDYHILSAGVVPAAADVGVLRAYIGIVAGGSATAQGGASVAQSSAFPAVGAQYVGFLQDPSDGHSTALLYQGQDRVYYERASAPVVRRGETLVIIVDDTEASDAVTRTWQAEITGILVRPED